MDAYRATVDKRDQRLFLPKPIPDEALRRILQAARMTGSSKNAEPNRLIVVRDRAGVAAVGAVSPWGTLAVHAAAIIVIVQTEPHEFDAGRCAQNMMVAAWNDGIGSCPAHLPEADLARLLDIPKRHGHQPRDRLRLRRSRARSTAEVSGAYAQAARRAGAVRAVELALRGLLLQPAVVGRQPHRIEPHLLVVGKQRLEQAVDPA